VSDIHVPDVSDSEEAADPPVTEPSCAQFIDSQTEQDNSSDSVGDNSRRSSSHRKSRCYRISGIPCHWDNEKALASLKSIQAPESELIETNLRLYPSATHEAQTGLISVEVKSVDPFFSNEETCKVFHFEGHELEVDSHFFGLTPLNRPRDVIAE
jgi:hypothetical protein